MVISAAYRGYKLAKRAYEYYKPVVRGESFVTKFPPQHRATVRTILRGSEIAFSGGLIADIAKDLTTELSQGNGGSLPFQNGSNKFFKKRSGRFGK